MACSWLGFWVSGFLGFCSRSVPSARRVRRRCPFPHELRLEGPVAVAPRFDSDRPMPGRLRCPAICACWQHHPVASNAAHNRVLGQLGVHHPHYQATREIGEQPARPDDFLLGARQRAARRSGHQIGGPGAHLVRQPAHPGDGYQDRARRHFDAPALPGSLGETQGEPRTSGSIVASRGMRLLISTHAYTAHRRLPSRDLPRLTMSAAATVTRKRDSCRSLGCRPPR